MITGGWGHGGRRYAAEIPRPYAHAREASGLTSTLVIERHPLQCGSFQNLNLPTVLAGNRQKRVCQPKACFLYIRRVITEVVGDRPGSMESRANGSQGLGAERCFIDQLACLCPGGSAFCLHLSRFPALRSTPPTSRSLRDAPRRSCRSNCERWRQCPHLFP
jgi:hypothetical protein